MQAFVRTGMTSGVALIGASAIALSPIVVAPQQVHLPAIPVSSIATTLTAQVDPISAWVQVLTASFSNISALGQQVWADPAPILKQILTNQLGYANTTATALGAAGNSFVTALQGLPPAFQQAAQQMAAGHIDSGIATVYGAVLGLVINPGFALLGSGVLDIPGKIAQNITNVVKLAPTLLVQVGFSLLSTAFSVESAFGDTAQAVYNGVHAGNLGAALNAIVNAPAVLTNAFLNGNPSLLAAGILTASGPGVPGVVAMVAIRIRDAIAQALGAPAPAAAAAASLAPVAAKVADVGPAALPSAVLSGAAVTLGAEKVTTPDTAKVAATKTAPAEPAATAPAAGAPTPAEPAATSPETHSPATETKPDSGTTSGGTTAPTGGTGTTGGTTTGTSGTAGEPTKPSGSTGSQTGSGSTTTPKGGTDTTGGTGTTGTTGGTKTSTPGTTGEPTKPTKPSGSTGSETGSGSTTTPNGLTSTTGGTKTGTPTKPAKPAKPSGSTGSQTGSGSSSGASGSGSGTSASGGGASHAAA
ncbi:hypothetical protein [Mycolicibacterium aubagnense]|uniref:PE-PGRS family protein n=1 Tax=Mycolicibacterium aubagnense TaxID=319707 RepID=A0ABM7IIB3_9MYCO|nr:hypothetical protein [Mycolicibacterium aubagnense]TLH68212.1 hypothetical protein C1S80_04310 [Mycolicibacterium aubagnense]WGI32084.1 hypothetical protein QDT91_23240 [Mycolicibacterium aubagnense]BBX86385.1 hypothetical protein MAUB_42580 [Mycolicibacterium aubagnense]